MQKNMAKILVFFIICLLGLGKVLIDNNNRNNAKNKDIQKIGAQNKSKNSAKKDTNARKKENDKKNGNISAKTGNRKYKIDYNHVIGGDENSSGKVTGGQTLLMGDVRIVKKIGNPASNGVYKATVEIKKKNGTWQKKTSNGGVNTMFPESWDEARVIDEINSAWENRKDYNGKDSNMWQGKSISGVLIRGFKSPRITAYPIYEGGK